MESGHLELAALEVSEVRVQRYAEIHVTSDDIELVCGNDELIKMFIDGRSYGSFGQGYIPDLIDALRTMEAELELEKERTKI